MTIEYKDSKRITAVSSDWTADVSSNITWSTTGKVGWNISGTTISRTGSDGWSTSKIQSTDTFTVGDGAFMIEFSGNEGSTMLGFNKGTLGYYYGSGSPQNSADFSIYLAGGSRVEVYESGTKNYDSGGSRNANDKFRIEVSNSGVVKYYLQEGGTGSFDLKHTSSSTASGTYFIQANAYSASSEATVHSKTVPTTVAKPSNVQDNSILVDKDTARRYWKSSSEDLKAYYKFADNGTNSATTDQGLGSSADMTVTGATYATGKLGNAISFDGTNDYTTIGSSTSQFNFMHNTTHEWTVSFWFKSSDMSSMGMIFTTMKDTSSQYYGVAIRRNNSSTMAVNFGAGTNQNRLQDTKAGFSTDGNWHHIVITAKASDSTNSLEYWQDGVSLGTTSNSGKVFSDTDASFAPYIGQANSDQYLDGALDELSIWNRRLSDSEIATLYNSGTGLAVDSANLRKATWTREGALDKTGLKAYWRFNEASGNIINQASSIGSTDSISSVDLTPYQSTHNVSKSPMNYSLQFDGTNDYAKAGTSTSAWNFMHSTTAKWTVCFWADMTGNSSGTIMGDAATNNTNNGIQMICTNVNGTFRARVTDGGGVVTQLITSSGFVPQDNTMHFYKITYDQSLSSDNMKMSVDNGTNVTQTKTANAPTDGNSQTELYIGSSDATNFFLAGEVAEMSIWSRVLTDAEVTAIYNSGSGVFPLF
jgi:hypothetical protein